MPASSPKAAHSFDSNVELIFGSGPYLSPEALLTWQDHLNRNNPRIAGSAESAHNRPTVPQDWGREMSTRLCAARRLPGLVLTTQSSVALQQISI